MLWSSTTLQALWQLPRFALYCLHCQPQLKTLKLMRFSLDLNVRVWSAYAICAINDSAPSETLNLLGELLLSDCEEERTWNESIGAITELGPRALPLLEQLERAKNHRSSSVRWGLVEAFFEIEPETAIERVLPLVRDENGLVAETAIEALSEHAAQDVQVINTYIWALGQSDGSFDQPARSAADALARIGSPAHAALPALKRLASDPEISENFRESVNLAIAAISRN